MVTVIGFNTCGLTGTVTEPRKSLLDFVRERNLLNFLEDVATGNQWFCYYIIPTTALYLGKNAVFLGPFGRHFLHR